MSSQSADQLWSDLQIRYRNIANYVDQGEYVRDIYSPGSSGFEYTVAIDSNQNVFHQIDGHRVTHDFGYQYRKSAGQEKGEFSRAFGPDEDVPRTLAEACASLYAVGGGVLHMAASLMFPNLYGPENRGQGPVFNPDSIIRAQDTVLNGAQTYVIEVYSSVYFSKEMIEDQERRADSIENVQYIPPYIKTRPERKPGLRKSLNTYFIQQSDGLICRWESFFFDGDSVSTKSILTMHPRSNVPEFEKYLTAGTMDKE
jgi:hypothetical protein